MKIICKECGHVFAFWEKFFLRFFIDVHACMFLFRRYEVKENDRSEISG